MLKCIVHCKHCIASDLDKSLYVYIYINIYIYIYINIYIYIHTYTYTHSTHPAIAVNPRSPPSLQTTHRKTGRPVPETPFGAPCARRCSHSLTPANKRSPRPHAPNLGRRGRNGPEEFLQNGGKSTGSTSKWMVNGKWKMDENGLYINISG